jgi:hypothetical protein
MRNRTQFLITSGVALMGMLLFGIPAGMFFSISAYLAVEWWNLNNL